MFCRRFIPRYRRSIDGALHRSNLYRRRQFRNFSLSADRASYRASRKNHVKLGLKAGVTVVVIGVLVTVPWWGSAVLVQFGINALILATLAQSWNIIGGYTGYPSFGNSVFYGLRRLWCRHRHGAVSVAL